MKNNTGRQYGGVVNSQEGAALLVTLLVVVIMTVTITEFLYSTWIDRSFAAGFRDTTKAIYALRSGVGAARRIVMDDYRLDGKNGLYVDTLKETWAQSVLPIPVEDTYMFVTITDESSKIDLNRLVTNGGYPDQARLDIFRRLLVNLGQDPDIANYVLDWVDANDEGPAENAYYMMLPHPYKCKNAKLDSLDELNRVRGITPDVLSRIKPFVTIRSIGYVNINTAPKEVIMALDGDITSALADSLIAARTENPFRTKHEIQTVDGFATIFPRIGSIIDVNTNTFSVSASITFNETTRKAEAILADRTSSTLSILYFRII